MSIQHMPTLTLFDLQTQAELATAYLRACESCLESGLPDDQADKLRYRIGDQLLKLAGQGFSDSDSLLAKLAEEMECVAARPIDQRRI